VVDVIVGSGGCVSKEVVRLGKWDGLNLGHSNNIQGEFAMITQALYDSIYLFKFMSNTSHAPSSLTFSSTFDIVFIMTSSKRFLCGSRGMHVLCNRRGQCIT